MVKPTRCSFCGNDVRRYKNTCNGPVCYNADCIAAFLASYLDAMEQRRGKDKANNKIAFQQAREMSAWLSIYRHGNTHTKSFRHYQSVVLACFQGSINECEIPNVAAVHFPYSIKIHMEMRQKSCCSKRSDRSLPKHQHLPGVQLQQ